MMVCLLRQKLYLQLLSSASRLIIFLGAVRSGDFFEQQKIETVFGKSTKAISRFYGFSHFDLVSRTERARVV
jgi:hypothetical protein